MKRKPDLLWVLVIVFGLGVVTTGYTQSLWERQDAAPVSLGDAGSTLIKIIVVMMLVLAGMWLLAAMFGASSSGSGSGWGRSSGGSFGGYSSGGGHK